MGVGVGVPGQVDRENGTVLSCPNLHVLDGAALGPEASAELGVPVYIDNNTNLISLGEHTAGVGKGVEDMAVVFVGSGVGCGLILNGELYEGADGVAAEFGHTKVVPNGLLCTCGGHGCLEMYCSGKALTLVAEQIFKPRDLYALGTRFAGAQLLIEQARAGHAQAREALTEAFIYLGVGLTSLVNLLNPRMIVLGGGIAGMQSALDLAEAGYKVYLVEKKPAIGGVMAELDKTFPTMDCSICILAPKMAEAGRHPNIELLTLSEVEQVEGYVGNFRIKVRKRARYVTDSCTSCGDCSRVCPQIAPDEFNAGLSTRRGIFIFTCYCRFSDYFQ